MLVLLEMFAKTLLLISFVILTNADKGNQCEKNEDCDMKDAVCVQKSCSCPPNMIANSLRSKCLPVSSGYGSICEDNVQCSEGLSSGGICNNGTCSCTSGYHYFLGQCWKSSGLGEECKKNENCFVSYDFEAAVCSEGICVCSLGYYQREYSSCRRESYKPGDPCGIYLDCKYDNAVCTMNRTCDTGSAKLTKIINDLYDVYVLEQNLITAQLNSKVSDSCKTSTDCPKNSECNSANTCSCLKGFYTTDNTTCHPEIGAKCDTNSDCVGKNTECRNQTHCVCKQGYVTSYNGRYCDKMARDIAWSCLRDEQCGLFGPHSLCLSKKCGCDDNSYYLKEDLYCWIKKFIGTNCTDNKDCGTGGGVSCQNGMCQCAKGYHSSSDQKECRKNSDQVGEECIENLDCSFSNSFCDIRNGTQNGTCDCIKGYISINKQCLSGAGGNCTADSDCKAEGSKCMENRCVCNNGFVSSKDFSKCLQIADHVDESCSEDSQCSKIEAACTNGRCSCLSGSQFVENSCYISKGLNQNCTSSGNCTLPNSYCMNHLCQCLPGHHEINNGTRCSSASSLFEQFRILPILFASFILPRAIASNHLHWTA